MSLTLYTMYAKKIYAEYQKLKLKRLKLWCLCKDC